MKEKTARQREKKKEKIEGIGIKKETKKKRFSKEAAEEKIII